MRANCGRVRGGSAHLVGIVEAEKPVLARIDVLVARIGTRDNKGGIHVHVVAGKVKGNQTLEDDGPSGEGRGQEDDEAGGGAAIRHHVEDGAEASRLFVDARDVAIEGVEETRDTVEERARARMEGHVVEGCDSEDDSHVAWRRGCFSNEEKEELVTGQLVIPMRLGQKRKMFSRGALSEASGAP